MEHRELGVRLLNRARHDAGVTPALVEMPDEQVEPVLLAVASGAEISAALATHATRPHGVALRPASSARVGEPVERSRR